MCDIRSRCGIAGMHPSESSPALCVRKSNRSDEASGAYGSRCRTALNGRECNCSPAPRVPHESARIPSAYGTPAESSDGTRCSPAGGDTSRSRPEQAASHEWLSSLTDEACQQYDTLHRTTHRGISGSSMGSSAPMCHGYPANLPDADWALNGQDGNSHIC